MKKTDCGSMRRRILAACGIGFNLAAAQAANQWTGPADGDWFDAANWSEGVPTNGATAVAGSGASILLTNATARMASFSLAAGASLTFQGWDSPLAADDLTISGTLTHLDHLSVTETNALGQWVTLHRVYLAGSNITIAAGAQVNADGKGYPRNAGPGGSKTSRDGGGHAGLGGSGYLAPGGGGLPYGDPVHPFQPGSGGGEPTKGREGGGVIRIEADGHLAVDGVLSANGINGATSHGGGGSGGSIWLSCRTFGGAATGRVRAQGGSGNAQGGGGSGGRLALHYETIDQAALSEPVPPVQFFGLAGAKGASVYGLYPAAMGTLHLPDTLFLTPNLAGQRFWHVQLVIPGLTEWTVPYLAVTNCVVGWPIGFRLTVTGPLELTNQAAFHFFAAPVDDPLTEEGARVSVGGDLLVTGSSWIYPYACDTNGATVAFEVDGDLFVAAGGGFNADARGYRWQHGPGLSGIRFSELGPGIKLSYSSGAGHGGGGGAGWSCSGCAAVGDAAAPRLPGSGSRKLYSARGGGSIQITVAGHAAIDGTLTAMGCRGDGSTDYGSAAGGSIWITCWTLGGKSTGMLRVNGGDGSGINGSGGGGRIAVYYNTTEQLALPAPACVFAAAGGAVGTTAPRRAAEMGTLYFPDVQLVPALVEGGRFSKVRLEIPGFSAWAPATLTMHGGEFMLPSGFELDVGGNFALLDGARLHLPAAPTNAPGTVGARLTVGGDLTIGAGAWIHPRAEWTNGAVVGIRVANHVTIAAGGGIDADGLGFAPTGSNQNGPGAGQNNSSGGGYGGRGGGTGGGAVYGRADLPLAPGSPGGWYVYSTGLRAGQGGGAIRLLAGGDIHLDGTLSANAMEKELNYGGVGASGGGIFVAARRLTGGGLLQANGSLNFNSASADGGGGRIAVWVGLPLSTVEARITAGDPGLTRLDGYAPFDGGSFEVLRASNAAQDGTAGIYGLAGTVLLVR